MLFSLYSFSFRFYAVNVPLHWASERIYERRWISMAFNHTTHSTVYSMYRPYIVKCTTNDYYLHTPRLEDNAMPYLSLRISFLAHIFPKICSQITERMGKNRKGCIDFFLCGCGKTTSLTCRSSGYVSNRLIMQSGWFERKLWKPNATDPHRSGHHGW